MSKNSNSNSKPNCFLHPLGNGGDKNRKPVLSKNASVEEVQWHLKLMKDSEAGEKESSSLAAAKPKKKGIRLQDLPGAVAKREGQESRREELQ